MRFLLLLIAGGLAPAAVLVVHSNAECRLLVDGKDRGTLEPGKQIRLKLSRGEHHVEAAPLAGGSKWLQMIAFDSSSAQRHVTIDLSANHAYWIDSSNNLMWTLADNGAGLSWAQAIRYCRESTLDGFRDWRLPGIDELQGIFNPANSNEAGFHLKGPLKLTGWQWSASDGQQPGEGWAFDFGDGGRASVAAGDSGLNRAVCVRPAQ